MQQYIWQYCFAYNICNAILSMNDAPTEKGMVKGMLIIKMKDYERL